MVNEMNDIYKEYSVYLKEKYGCKVYKLPINLPVTCPNRDGNIGYHGCTYCGEKGAGFEMLDVSISIKDQLIKNKEYIKKKYKAQKFIAYFQNYTNTYLPLNIFRKYIEEGLIEDVVGISISTRPDCINEEYASFLSNLKNEKGIDIVVELGLQTCNYKSLIKINRGHTLAEYIDAVMILNKYNLEICTHIILNLPFDDKEDAIENAKVLSALKTNYVKVHSLYILKNTVLGDEFLNNEFKMISKEEYLERLKTFISYLSPEIVVQRLFGRAPEEDTLFSNWNTSWWKLRDEFIQIMKDENLYQGIKFNYLNGKSLNKFN
jgi:hypothetical protein